MRIITKEIEEAFKKQGDTSEKEMSETKIVLKLFAGNFTWYIYEKIDDDTYVAFVNLGDPIYAELGTISLSEIMDLKFAPLNLGVERDMHFEPLSLTLQEVYDIVKSGGHV